MDFLPHTTNFVSHHKIVIIALLKKILLPTVPTHSCQYIILTKGKAFVSERGKRVALLLNIFSLRVVCNCVVNYRFLFQQVTLLPEVFDEVTAECTPDCCCSCFLLAVLFCYCACCSDGAVK